MFWELELPAATMDGVPSVTVSSAQELKES
jgi:hypothetical protein